MYTVQTQTSFEAAHRLYNVDTYSEECRNNIHGHSYKVTIVVGRANLNDANMVIDFKQLKEIIRDEIENIYDHSCILNAEDPLAKPIYENCKKVIIVPENPTAEWMSVTFHHTLKSTLAQLDDQLKVISVSVQETENNIACYSEEVCKCK